MNGHLFADETKQNGFLIVIGVVLTGDLDQTRRSIRELIKPGQRRLHMKDESEPRKKLILSKIGELGLESIAYDAGKRYRTQRDARAACLRKIVQDASADGHTRLTLELDSTLEQWDRQNLIEANRACGKKIDYTHQTASSEPLLAIPDALAWAHAKGGDWRRRAGISRVWKV